MLSELGKLKQAFPWSAVRNVTAYPTHEQIGMLSKKDLGRCVVYLLNDLVNLKKAFDEYKEQVVKKND